MAFCPKCQHQLERRLIRDARGDYNPHESEMALGTLEMGLFCGKCGYFSPIFKEKTLQKSQQPFSDSMVEKGDPSSPSGPWKRFKKWLVGKSV